MLMELPSKKELKIKKFSLVLILTLKVQFLLIQMDFYLITLEKKQMEHFLASNKSLISYHILITKFLAAPSHSFISR